MIAGELTVLSSAKRMYIYLSVLYGINTIQYNKIRPAAYFGR
jgi:hypothetical protein